MLSAFDEIIIFSFAVPASRGLA